MSALSNILRQASDGYEDSLIFWCPGCDDAHQVRISGDKRPRWEYNGNAEAPTFSPSILVKTVRMEGGDAELDRILDEYKLPEDRDRVLADKRIQWVCHSYVTDGNIQFLSDCTHKLAGQTVPLPPFPE